MARDITKLFLALFRASFDVYDALFLYIITFFLLGYATFLGELFYGYGSTAYSY